MSDSSFSGVEALSPERARQFEDVCNRFEAAWKTESSPRIEDFLEGWTESERLVLLRELIGLDTDYHRGRGHPCAPADYGARFPEFEPHWLQECWAVETVSPAAASALTPTGPIKVAAPGAGSPSDLPSLDDYDELKEIGRGGMGVVYKARQVAVNRVVALKMIISGAHAGPDALNRFKLEAEAIARLHHPNIVQVYDFGWHNGQPFISLEFVEGGSLADKVRGEPQLPRSVALMVETLARAMHAVHVQNLIHRDLKPANVLVAMDGTLKITDFGLARKTDNSVQTVSGAVLGTPSYMAPEQAMGLAHDIGPATDIYALGTILYDLLTGRPPFKAGTVMDTMRQVISDDPAPPSRLNSQVPRDLEIICLKCLEKLPGKRYATAEALADDLRAFLDGRPIQARPVGRLERGWRWGRRNPALAMASALGVLLLATLIIVPIAFAIAETRNSNRLTDEKGKTEEALKDSRKSQRTAETAERAALRQAAASILEQALSLCERGEQGRGLLWMARGLKLAQRAGDAELEDAFRWNIGSWSAETHELVWVATCPSRVNSVALSPDNTLLAACGWEKEVRLWQTDTGNPFGKPLLHPGKVWSVAFHPEGRLLLTGCEDGIARLWNIETGQMLEPTMLHYRSADSPRKAWPWTNGISSVAFSPDGKIAATAGCNNTVRLWSVLTGEAIGSPLRHSQVVFSVAFSPDGRTLASGGVDKKVHLWKVETGQEDGTPIDCGGDIVRSVAFSPDGQTLLTGLQQSSQVLRWNRTSRSKVGLPLKHRARVYNATVLRDGSRIVSVSEDQTARIWDTGSGQQVGPSLPHSASVSGLAVSSDGRFIVSGSADGSLRLWKIAPGNLRHTFRPGPNWLRAAAFSPDDSTLLIGTPTGFAQRWDLATESPLPPSYRNPPGDHWVQGVAFSPDAKTVYTTDTQGEVVQRWETTSGRGLGVTTEKHGDEVWRMVLSPDGTKLLTGAHDYQEAPRGRNARLWDAESGKPIGPPLQHAGNVFGLAFSSDSKRVLTGSHDRTTRLWDAATGEALGPPVKHSAEIWAVAFRPDGEGYLTGGGDRNVRQWDQSWNPVGAPMQHNGVITSVGYSSDARLIFSSSQDGTARVWHAGTGKPIGPAMQHSAAVNALVRTRDESLLATCGDDGAAKIWTAPTRVNDLVTELSRRLELHTGLTLDEAGTVEVLEEPGWRERHLLEERNSGTVRPFLPPNELTQRLRAGRACVRQRQWDQAATNFGQALVLKDDAYVRQERGEVYARQGKWEQAATDYTRAFELEDPDVPELWQAHALLRLQVGDAKGYQQLCTEMVKRFGKSGASQYVRFLPAVCILAPNALDKPASVVALAERRQTKFGPSSTGYYVLGLAYYRAGQDEQAIAALGKGLQASPASNLGFKVWCWLTLAMAHHRLGHAAEARQWLDKAERLIDQILRETPPAAGEFAPLGWDWFIWLKVQLLRREAEALLAGKKAEPEK